MDRSNTPNRRARAPAPPLAYHKYDKFGNPGAPSSYPQVDPLTPPVQLPNTHLFSTNPMPAQLESPYSHHKPRDASSIPNPSFASSSKPSYPELSSSSLYLDPHFSMSYPSSMLDFSMKQQYPVSSGSSSHYLPEPRYPARSDPMARMANESASYYQEYDLPRVHKSRQETEQAQSAPQGFSFNANVRNVPVAHSSVPRHSSQISPISASRHNLSGTRTSAALLDPYATVSEPVVWRGTLSLHLNGFVHEVPAAGRRCLLEGRKELDRNVSRWPSRITIQPTTMDVVTNVDHFLSNDSVMWYLRFEPTSSIDSKLVHEVTAKIQDERLIALTRLPNLNATLAVLACMGDEGAEIHLIGVFMPFLVDPRGTDLRRSRPLMVSTPLARKHGPVSLTGRYSLGKAPEIWKGSLCILGKKRQLNMKAVAVPVDITSITDDALSWPAIIVCKWHTCVGSDEVPNDARSCALFRSDDSRFVKLVNSLIENKRAMVSTTTNGVLYLTGRNNDLDILGRFLVTGSDRSPRAQAPRFGAVGSKC